MNAVRTPLRAMHLGLSLLLGIACAMSAAHASPDVDGDGRVTLADLKMLSVDLNTLAAAWKGDVNGDGQVDREDVKELARVLILRGAPSLEATDELVEALVRHAVSGGGAGEVLEIVRGLERATPGPGSGDGRVRGAVGRPVRLAPGLSRYYAGLRETPGATPAPPSYGDLTARRARSFGGPLGDRKAQAAFDAFVAAHPTGADLASGDPPDPGALGETTRRARSSPLLVARDSGERSRVLPRGAVALVLNPDDPAAVALRATVRGSGGTLDDEYRRVSGLGDLADATRTLVDPAYRDLPDPLLSQLVADLADPEEFLKQVDADRDRTVTLDEVLTHLFSPGMARKVMLGDPEALGLKSGSAVARNYAAIANAALPALQAAGVVDPGFASATLAAVNGTAVAGRPPGAQPEPDGTIGGGARPGADPDARTGGREPDPGTKRPGTTTPPPPGPDPPAKPRQPAKPVTGKTDQEPGTSGDTRDVAAAKVTLKAATAQLQQAQAEVAQLKREMAALKTKMAEYERKINAALSISEATYYSKLWQEVKNQHTSKNDSLRLTSQAVASYEKKIKDLKARIAAGGQ